MVAPCARLRPHIFKLPSLRHASPPSHRRPLQPVVVRAVHNMAEENAPPTRPDSTPAPALPAGPGPPRTAPTAVPSSWSPSPPCHRTPQPVIACAVVRVALAGASTVGPPACPRCTHWPGPASIHPHGRHSSISRSTHTPYRRRTPPLPSPSPVPTASRSSPPFPSQGPGPYPPDGSRDRWHLSATARTPRQHRPAPTSLPPQY